MRKEGRVCKETPNWVPLPLPLTGGVTLGTSPNLSGPVLSHLQTESVRTEAVSEGMFIRYYYVPGAMLYAL